MAMSDKSQHSARHGMLSLLAAATAAALIIATS
jgi:hypothetical protein